MSVTEAAARLRRAGIEQPQREARRLRDFAGGEGPAFESAIARRAAREPAAFITGTRGFWTLDLAVSPATLIPRPESETLIEAALAAFPALASVRRILDLGTGTGCLLLAALVEFPAAFGIGVDLAPAAVALARRNAAANGLAARAAFLAGDWAAALGGRFDLVLCNPPYIASADLPALQPELRHEPVCALDGGAQGLHAYRVVLPELRRLIAPAGAAILELGAGQLEAVAALAGGAGLASAGARPDLSGTPRALVLRL